MKGIIISLPIWGDSYVDLWAKYALPSMLAPGNLPYLNRLTPTVVNIYTDAQTQRRITATPRFRDLMDSCLVSIQTIGATPFHLMETLHAGYRHGGTCFKNCCNMAILQAFGRDAGYITWSADAIWSNSAGKKIEETLNANKRALMYVGYRMEAALDGPFVSLLEASRSGSTIDVDPLAMCKAYLEESGVGSMPSSIIEPDFGKNPSNLRWST